MQLKMQDFKEAMLRLKQGQMQKQAQVQLFMVGHLPKWVECPPEEGPVNDNKPEVSGSVFDSAVTFIEGLKKKGFEYLGSGSYSTYVGKPGQNRVIKVTAQAADGWISYIKWAEDNGQTGKLAPKVYSYKYIKGKKYGFAVAVVERLHKFKDLPIVAKMSTDLKDKVRFWDYYCGANFMFRRDGSIVLSDPAVFNADNDTQRFRSAA